MPQGSLPLVSATRKRKYPDSHSKNISLKTSREEKSRMAQFLLDVPEDGLVHIASFLNAPDLLQFLSSHPRLVLLSKTASFWRTLITNATDNPLKTCDSFECAHAAKCAYLTKAYVQALPVIEWKPCRSSRLSPTGREGKCDITTADSMACVNDV